MLQMRLLSTQVKQFCCFRCKRYPRRDHVEYHIGIKQYAHYEYFLIR